MSVLSRVRLAWGAGVGVVLAAVGAALLTQTQKPAAAEPVAPLPTGLQYVPTDAALFGHVEFAPLWKSALGDTFRKLKVPQLDAALKELTAVSGLKLDDVKTFTIWMPALKQPQDMQRFGVVITTEKAYDRKVMIATLEATSVAKTGKYENKGNVIRVTPKNGQPPMFADLSADNTIVLGMGLADEPKADPARAAGPHSAALKHAAGAVLLGGVNFANLPDEIRRDEENFPPQMRPFIPIAKSDTISLVGKLAGKDLALAASIVSPKKDIAADVEKSLDILRKLAKTGLDEAAKELDQAEKDGDDLKALRPLLKVASDVLKFGKLEVNDRTTTATLTVPADVPYAAFVEFVTGGKATSNAQDQNNLKQLGLSLHNYASTFGTLPPTYLVDKKGKPTLSWRVMVLPYIEQDNLYTKFKMDEPWDSEHNMKVFKDHPMPPVFLYPGDKAEDKKTRYRVFTGSGAGWDVTGKLKFTDFTDGTSNTIAIATAETAVPWTKPEELEFDAEKDVKPLLHFRGDRTNICIFDGSVRGLSKKAITEATLKGAVTRAGGEVLGADW